MTKKEERKERVIKQKIKKEREKKKK